MSKSWSNLAQIVYKRTYSRKTENGFENWIDTVERAILGNVSGFNLDTKEIERLKYYMFNRKAVPAGRGLWYSGTASHKKLGGVALNNCFFLTGEHWSNLVAAQDLLMLGGGVGLSVEHRYVSKLPRIKKNVKIEHKNTKDADFIVPDSREGWNRLIYKVLEAFFETGRSFSYSTICIRGAGEPIIGFGGISSGPKPLIQCVESIQKVLQPKAGKHAQPIDVTDLICSIGEMVVSGNVRRSAIMIIGDCWDKEYLKAKRWDINPNIPPQRAKANFSVICDDVEDLHPLFWKTFEAGEAFGIVNRTNIQKYGRIGELKKDTAIGVNPCFAKETMIQIRHGHYPIETLVGQNVEIWNGQDWQFVDNFRVTAENQPMLKITLHDGSYERVTLYHTCILENGTRIQAKDLNPGMKLAYSNAPLTYGQIKVKGAYLKGFIVADGDVTDNKINLKLYSPKYICKNRILDSAKEIPIEKINTNAISALEFVAQGINKQNRQNLTGLACRRNELFKWALDYKKQLPNDIYNWDSESKLNFIAGFMDGDGCNKIGKNGFGYQVSSVEKQFLFDFQKLLKTIGIKSKLGLMHKGGKKDFGKFRGGIYTTLDSWRLSIAQENSIKLSKIVKFTRLMDFSDKACKRKVETKHNIVIAVEPDGIDEKVYCCTVEGSHSLGLSSGNHWANCAEACLEEFEACNLQDIALPNLDNEIEFEESARLMHRWGKRVSCENYHIEKVNEVVHRNRRIGTGITGCLQSPLFCPGTLNNVYNAIQDENVKYSKELNIPISVRTTVIKPSGTISKILDVKGEGIHGGLSKYMIQRIRFEATDPAIPLLREAGHHMEPEIKLDGTLNRNTLVVDFYEELENLPLADDGWNTWEQLEVVKMAQKYWSDQSISVSIYYDRTEIPKIKEWFAENLSQIKTISFLCRDDHGFKQAPKEKISKEQYIELSSKIKAIKLDSLSDEEFAINGSLECEKGVCPIK